ncbi:MAG: vWA domain-containing protein [Woeseia sp.]
MRELQPNLIIPAGRLMVLLLLGTALLLPGATPDRSGGRIALLIHSSASASANQSATVNAALAKEIAALDGRLKVTPVESSASKSRLDDALEQTLWQLDPAARNAIVIASNGHWSAELEPLLKRVSAAGIPVYWRPMDDTDAPRILHIAAASRAQPGDALPVVVSTSPTPDGDFELVLRVNGEPVSRKAPPPNGRTAFSLPVTGGGPLRLGADLVEARSGVAIHHLADAAVVDITTAPRLLLLAGGSSPLGDALAAGGWPLRRVSAPEFPAVLHDLTRYSALILDNVPAGALPESAWLAIADAVQRDALGLLVLGGPQAFGLGGYRGSTLESLLPVISEPPQREQPAGVVFLVDASGSMGRDAGERLRIARAAVLHTAAALRDTDRLGLIAFDVEARALLPVEARGDHAAALQTAWPDRASGGTSIVPALQAGLASLAAADTEQKLLILVSDGQLAAEDVAALEAALDGSDVELIAMLLSDGDSEQSLSRMAASGKAALLSIDDVLQLPLLMRQQVEARRPALQREVTQPLRQSGAAFRELPLDWPALDAYLVTRPRPEARVILRSPRGEPLLAEWSSGAGRVVAATAGLGDWAANWFTWELWPSVATALVEHVIVRESPRVRIIRETQDGDAPALVLDTGQSAPPRRVLVVPADGPPATVSPIAAAPGLYRVPLDVSHRQAFTVVWENADGLFRQVIPASSTTQLSSLGEPEARRLVAAGLLEEWAAGTALPPSIHDLRPPIPWRQVVTAAALLFFLLVLVAERRGAIQNRYRIASLARRPAAAKPIASS